MRLAYRNFKEKIYHRANHYPKFINSNGSQFHSIYNRSKGAGMHEFESLS
jgi:hypothetical protein